MKILAALSLAAVLTAGSVTGASAFVSPGIEAEGVFAHQFEANVEPTHYDRCHGRTSGTAHHSCGTKTGGPAGGLF